jgi:archaellum biogenesis protein FlaJ (TadC family)
MNNQNQKGANMQNHTQTDTWIYRITIVLGLIVVISVVGAIILALMGKPIPETLIVMAVVAMGGLARILVPSLLNIGLFE